jgi:hypothetical protein
MGGGSPPAASGCGSGTMPLRGESLRSALRAAVPPRSGGCRAGRPGVSHGPLGRVERPGHPEGSSEGGVQSRWAAAGPCVASSSPPARGGRSDSHTRWTKLMGSGHRRPTPTPSAGSGRSAPSAWNWLLDCRSRPPRAGAAGLHRALQRPWALGLQPPDPAVEPALRSRIRRPRSTGVTCSSVLVHESAEPHLCTPRAGRASQRLSGDLASAWPSSSVDCRFGQVGRVTVKPSWLAAAAIRSS